MKRYVVLAVLIVIVFAIVPVFLPSGGVTADTLSYLGMTSDLPDVKTNLFPIGFPVFIKIFQQITDDYYWASKIAVGVLPCLMLAFSYYKKFYFPETVLLFTGKTLFFVFTGILSESIFIFLLYFLWYQLHTILQMQKIKAEHIFLTSILLILMLLIRYSALYIILGMLVFILISWTKDKKQHFIFPLLKIVFLTSFGSGIYFVVNYFYFGSFTGEHLRGPPQPVTFIQLMRNLSGWFNMFNPYIGIKPSSNSAASVVFQIILCAFDVFLLCTFIRHQRKNKNAKDHTFHLVLICLGLTYALMLLISVFLQQIEEMNTRMLAASNLCFFFSILIIIFKNTKNKRLLFGVGCFMLLFLSVYALKNPFHFIAARKKLQPQLEKLSKKKYLFNNETAEKNVTVYYFKWLDKTVKYPHTEKQKGYLKMNLAGSLKPELKWLLTDTVQNKSQVLYTSELEMD